MSINSIFAWLIKKRIHQIDLFRKYPLEVQEELFNDLIKKAKNTEWGQKHHYSTISNYSDFQNQVPLQDYNTLKPYIDRMINGEKNILWSTDIQWFAKSSGTTSDRSKFIPVSKESVDECHFKGGKDLLALYYQHHHEARLYKGKHLIIGGSVEINNISENTFSGDLSAIIVKSLPWWAERRRTPSKDIAMMHEWEAKIDKMAHSTIHEDVCILAGVPSWTLVLLRRILEITGKTNIKDIWPNLELYMHGGVNFEPYRQQFLEIFKGCNVNFVETYNASEGFFGIQDQLNSNELLLMLDYGIFYEFIPMSDFIETESKNVISLNNVEIGVNYAVVISTNGGLWRYILGDTIKFTSTLPYRFQITGRTKSFINTFGEEVIVDNTEKAIAEACKQTNANVKDYTVAPKYMENQKKGAHEWLIEFDKTPVDIEEFSVFLDKYLRSINSDYDAKRYKGMILEKPIIHIAPSHFFENWLKDKQKLGGQNKISRLSNNRDFMNELLSRL